MDPTALIDSIPGTPQTKASIAAALGILYLLACIARGFFSADSLGGKVCSFLIDGLKPRAPKVEAKPPAAAPAAKPPVAPVAFAILAAGSLLFPGAARADSSVCLTAGCGYFLAPSVSFSGAAYDFDTRSFVRDFQVGGLVEIQKAGFPLGFAAGVSVQTGEVQGFAATEAITGPGLPGPLKNAAILAHEVFLGDKSSLVVGAGYVVRF